MASQTRLDVYNAIADIGAVPVFHISDVDDSIAIARACVSGGMRVVEFTNRGDHAHEVFSPCTRPSGARRPRRYSGPVLCSTRRPPLSTSTRAPGSSWAPIPTRKLPACATGAKVAYIPGCGTASEISYAEELGCEIVKLFPAQASGGPGFVKDLLGPMPWSSIMPTGGIGVGRETLQEWFDAGVIAVGLGSSLVTSDIVTRRAWDELERRCRAVVSSIREIRAGR